MQIKKTYKTVLRYSSKKQKNEIKSIAIKSGRSVNSQILFAIDELIKNQPPVK